MINSLDDAPADTNYWQYFGWGVGAGYNGAGQDKLPGHYEVQGSAGPDTSYANISYVTDIKSCLLYTSPSPRDQRGSRMPSSA